MPTYQYACTACEDRLEVVQRFTDDPLTECPSCHGRLRKVFSSVGIVFKGSGFYRTDSRNASSGSGKRGSSPDKKEPSKSADSGGKDSSSSAKDSSSSSSSGASSEKSGGSGKTSGGSKEKVA